TTTRPGEDFAFEDTPIGLYELQATDDITGDRGSASVTVTGAGTFRKNVTLTGVGRVRVLVGDPPVGDAQVSLFSSGGSNLSGKTPSGGAPLVFDPVLAGDVVVRAHDASVGRGGSVKFHLQPAEDPLVAVPFDPVGRLHGHVFAPDGRTPAATVQVTSDGRAVSSHRGDAH